MTYKPFSTTSSYTHTNHKSKNFNRCVSNSLRQSATGPNTGQTEEKSFPVCTDRFIRVRKEHPARHEQARVTEATRAGAKNCGRNVVSVWYLRFTDQRMRWCVSGRRRFPIDRADPWEKCSRGTIGKCDYTNSLLFCFRLSAPWPANLWLS